MQEKPPTFYGHRDPPLSPFRLKNQEGGGVGLETTPSDHIVNNADEGQYQQQVD